MDFPYTLTTLLISVAILSIAWIIYSIFRRQIYKIKEIEKASDIQSELQKQEVGRYKTRLSEKNLEIENLTRRLAKAEPYGPEEEDDW